VRFQEHCGCFNSTLCAAAGHSTIIDAYMSLAILADDRARYDRAVDLFHKTGANLTNRMQHFMVIMV
jgi:hypothetical protein